jgi:hypothetical protein
MAAPNDRRKPRLLPAGNSRSTIQRRLRVLRRLLKTVDAMIDKSLVQAHVPLAWTDVQDEAEKHLCAAAENLIELIARLSVRDRPKDRAPE